jgi:DNA-binding LytR/AlgR family response regulator
MRKLGIGDLGLVLLTDICRMNLFQAPLKRASRGEFYRVAVFIGLSVFLVLAVFQPFGTYNFQHAWKYPLLAGYGVVITVSTMAAWELVNWLFLRQSQNLQWTLRLEFGLIAFVFFFSASMTFFYQHIVLGGRISVTGYFLFMAIAAATSVFPLAILLIVRLLQAKNNLEKTLWLSQNPQPDALATLTLRGENKHETLTLLKRELLYLRSADNYVEIFLLKNQTVQRLMLRIALSRLPAQLDAGFLQTHRSYIVNLNQPLRLEGKSPNYQLVFENLPGAEPVPVSKTFLAELRAALAKKPR